VVNDQGELLQCCITPSNVDDRRPALRLVKKLFGKLIEDNGYVSQALAKSLRQMFDTQIITKLRNK